MNLSDPEIEKYITEHSTPEEKILNELNRRTWLDMVYPQMLAGHLQGMLLEMFSYMIRPRTILEIGTYTGYSAICLAKGLSKDGKLYTIELQDEHKEMIESYFSKACLADRITLLIGDAREIIPGLAEQLFDLVYIDGEKEEYVDYYRLVIERVKPGGIILADNVLWGGKVLQQPSSEATATRGVIEFNKMVQEDSRVENTILAIRDGLMIIRKLDGEPVGDGYRPGTKKVDSAQGIHAQP